jgi:hypothetical protein
VTIIVIDPKARTLVVETEITKRMSPWKKLEERYGIRRGSVLDKYARLAS